MKNGVLSLLVNAMRAQWSVMSGFINGSGIVSSVTSEMTGHTRVYMNIYGMGADAEKGASGMIIEE